MLKANKKQISKRIGVAYKSKKIIKKEVGIKGTYFQAYLPNSFEVRVAQLVNTERRKAGLKELIYVVPRVRRRILGRWITLPIPAASITNTLGGIARLKSQDMRDKKYFAHTSPTYGTPQQMVNSFGHNHPTGENIAAGYSTPEAVMVGWMNSPGHKANILRPDYTHIGVGYVAGVSGSPYKHYWTQLFSIVK